jgi:o-succinylbenzoate synthase
MRIVKANAIPTRMELKEPFVIANETTDFADNIFIRLETETGLIGWGCSTPDSVTKENKDTVIRNFEVVRETIEGSDPLRINQLSELIENKIKGNPSLKAGINMAFYDILGKKADLPLHILLGGYREKIETSVTIGINPTDLMVKRAKQILADGFRSIKIKCGINVQDDIENVLAIRKTVGPDVKLRLDANEGYSVEDAITLITTLEESGADIELLEQPTKAAFLYSLKDVTAQLPVPIMADETALTLADSFKLVKLEIADMINIKLMKIGGITNAIKANTVAESANIPVMIGCMNESMGAMSAGVHFACAFKNVQYADLDSALDFENDVVEGGARYENGFVIPSNDPGLGIRVKL